MTETEQKRYLIRFLRAAMRQLMIYRTFAEMAKQQNLNQTRSILRDIEGEPSLATQLGPDFETFLESLLDGSDADADKALEHFLTTWLPSTKLN